MKLKSSGVMLVLVGQGGTGETIGQAASRNIKAKAPKGVGWV